MIRIDDIKSFFRGRIALSEPLRAYTWMRVGGPADYFLEPADKDDAVAIVAYLQRENIPFALIGRGSNLLVSDEGVRGVVLHLETGLSSLHAEGNRVFVDAGVTIVRFADFCVQRGLRGVEMLAGIPGTIGGALVMNAGAYGGEISDHLVDVEIVRGGAQTILKKEELKFSYRRSSFNGRDVILSASFEFPSGDREEIARMRQELLLKRNRTQPTNFPNSGSMFKNPPGSFAAKLIEQVGLKGKRIGNAQISEKHANFIVNLGDATAKDVLDLLELARTTVLGKLGIALELEVKLLGFPENVVKGLA